MLPRFLLFKKPERLTTSLSSPKWHYSSSIGTGSLRINSSFTTCAALGLTVFSLSTLYALSNRKRKVTASPIVNNNDSKDNKKCPQWNFNWDNRHNPAITSTKGPIRSFTLIRHGQYVHALLERNKILTNLGRNQAKITGKKLKSFDIDFDEIICSSMIRAKQSVDIILNELYDDIRNKNIEIKYDSNLNEGAPAYCIPEREDLNKSGFWDKMDDDSVRISKAFETYIHRNDTNKDEEILIIGHGNVFRYFLMRVLQFPAEAWLRFAICNCSITRFKIYGDGRVSVECIGSNGHFTKEQLTFN